MSRGVPNKSKSQQRRVATQKETVTEFPDISERLEKIIPTGEKVKDILKAPEKKKEQEDMSINDVSEIIEKGTLYCRCGAEIGTKNPGEIAPAKKMNVMTRDGYVEIMCTCGRITRVAKDYPGLSIMSPGFRRIY